MRRDRYSKKHNNNWKNNSNNRREKQEEPKPVEEKKPKRNLLEGINIFWRNTIKKAEDAAEKIKEIREEEV